MYYLTGKVAILTGSTRGIGRAGQCDFAKADQTDLVEQLPAGAIEVTPYVRYIPDRHPQASSLQAAAHYADMRALRSG
jgi:NAD(P)-dependent dehydrogenase (short-subunit alcohol dehydrogenase family)